MTEIDFEQLGLEELQELLDHANPQIRSDAICSLGDRLRLKSLSALPREIIEQLAKLLGDDSFLVQLESAITLAEIQDHRGTFVLMEAVRRKDFRLDALRALGQMQDPMAIALLQNWMEKRFAPWADRMQAAAALAELGIPTAYDYLEKKLSSRKKAERAAAIHFLGATKHPAASEHLLRIVKETHDPHRDCAARALGLLGNVEILPELEQLLSQTVGDLNQDIRVSIHSLQNSL